MSIQTELIPHTDLGKSFHDALDRRLTQLFSDQKDSAATPHMAQLWQQIAKATNGGKRARPMLVHLGYRTVSEQPEPRLLEIGCAFELLHTALVIHDDIIDQDFVRRGEPTLSAHYRDAALAQGKTQRAAEHLGQSAALLAGDALISQATHLIHDACRDLPCANRVLELFHSAIAQSAAGELDDVLFSADFGAPNLDEVLRMHQLKTAAYSFETPLVIGALLAGASDELLSRLSELAGFLGSCYQIIDDVLGTFGDSTTTGKSSDSDLREGKTTVLIALAESIETAAPTIAGWRAGTVHSDTVRRLLIDYNIERKARKLAQQYCERAKLQVDDLPIRSEARASFQHLINELQQRKH